MLHQGTAFSGAMAALSVAVMVLSSGVASAARAQQAQDIAASIAPSVVEVIVGGQWSGANANGAYRAVLIYRIIDAEPVADIVVQWLAFAEGDQEAHVAHVETVLSITGEEANTTFVAFDFGAPEAEPEATRLLIGWSDPDNDADETRFLKLGEPGAFEFVDARSDQPTGQ